MLNIYVGNLPYNTGNEELSQLFSQFGTIQRATVVIDRETNRSRGFGFVEMGDDDEGRGAIEALNGQDFGGRALTVNEAKPRPDRQGGNGGGGGGGGGGYGGSRGRGGGSGGYAQRQPDRRANYNNPGTAGEISDAGGE